MRDKPRRLGLFWRRMVALGIVSAWALGCSNANGGGSLGNVSPTPTPGPSLSPTASPSSPSNGPTFYTYKVLKSYPHDTSAYTQGLVVRDGVFYESTGRYGQSSVRRVEIETGKVLKKSSVAAQYFAEGLTERNQKLYQLTWQEGVCFVYEKDTFKKVGQFQYDGEGWGLTDNGSEFILSDGTNKIRFLDPATFAVKRTISVMDGASPLDQLNELEYIDGEIWANIWRTNSIVRISPRDGKILAWIDMTGILPSSERNSSTDVLNGIAYDTEKKRLFVTGKNWPKVYEIELIRQ